MEKSMICWTLKSDGAFWLDITGFLGGISLSIRLIAERDTPISADLIGKEMRQLENLLREAVATNARTREGR